MRRFLREPLVHFLLIGAVLFGLYGLAPAGASAATAPSKEIRLSARARSPSSPSCSSRSGAASRRRRSSSSMVENKVQQEILYREALAMGLDKDDEIVKRRMAQKMQFLAEDVAAAHEPTTAELKSWFEKNSAKFAQPPAAELPASLLLARPARRPRARRCGSRRWRSSPASRRTRRSPSSLADPFMFQDYYRDRAPDYLGKEFGPQFALAVGQARAGLVAGADRVRLRLAPRVRRHRDSRPRAGLRGDRARREDRVARRAEGAGLGEGVQGDARQVHGAAARAARGRGSTAKCSAVWRGAK